VEAELKELEARKVTAEAVERLAGLELNRFEKLRNTAAFNQSLYDQRVQELEVARSNRREAEARIARGRVNLELARIELRDSVIRAPYRGTITLRHTNEGAWLSAGDEVVTLVNDDDLEIEADVLSTYLPGLRPGARVNVTLDDGRQFEASVRAEIPDENPSARTRAVRFRPNLDSVELRLAVNQPATLQLPAGLSQEIVSVHKDAVLRRGGRDMVYLVRDGAAAPRPVELGQAVGSRFQVLGGLEPGDVVVVRGNERLRPGQAVTFRDKIELSGTAGRNP
jgi:RND family efflux transporter MFP subunit